MRPAALLAALLALACSPTLSVYAESPLESDTHLAIDAWNEALSRGPCPEVGLYLTAEPGAEIEIRAGKAGGNLGWTYDRQIEINTAAHDKHRRLVTTIAHELGHALGSEHSTLREDLMYPTVQKGRGPEPTGYDVARVCEYWGFP